MSEWYDRKWILSRLPHDIPQDIVDHAFDGMGQYYVKKAPLVVWCIREREADHVVERFAYFWHPKNDDSWQVIPLGIERFLYK